MCDDAREELERTQNRLEKVLESVPEAVLMVGPENRVIDTACNRSVEKIFGYEPGELRGETTEKLHVNRENFLEFGRVSEAALEETGCFETEWRMRRKDGTVIDTHNIVTPLDEEAGWQAGVVSVVRDITRRKGKERRIERLNSVLRAMRRLSQLIVKEPGPEDLLQKACEIVRSTSHYQRVWALAFDAEGALKYSGSAGLDEAFEKLVGKIQRGPQPECVLRALDTCGSPIRLGPEHRCRHCRLTGLCSDQESLRCGFQHGDTARCVIGIDLKPGQRAEEEELDLLADAAADVGRALRRIHTQENLRLRDRAIEMSRTGISFIDLDGTVVGANPAAVEMGGHEDESEVVGQHAREFSPSPERVREALRSARQQGEWTGEVKVQRRDGTTFTALATLSLVEDDEGEATHMVLVFLDMTEQKRVERRLQGALEELRDMQRRIIDHERHRALTQMASGIAHDFNNALSTIRGFTELLLHEPEKGPTRRRC
jgi:PAS domain S-box-containing protein